jgi:hypothetical protein
MANGLDDQWDGEVVETLEKLCQQCKMREMAARKATQREQLKDKQAISKREQPLQLQQELIKIKRRKVTSKI